MFFRGQTAKPTDNVTIPITAPRASEAAIQMYFDGPIKAIFELLNWLRERITLIRLEIKEDNAVLLSSSRQSIIDKMAMAQSDVKGAIRELEGRLDDKFRNLDHNIDALHERSNNADQALTRIDTRLNNIENMGSPPRPRR